VGNSVVLACLLGWVTARFKTMVIRTVGEPAGAASVALNSLRYEAFRHSL